MLLLSVLLLGLIKTAFSVSSCDIDAGSNCKATCNGTVLDVSNLFTHYPYNITLTPSESQVGDYFLYSPCEGIKCQSSDDYESAVCLSDKSEQSSCGRPGPGFITWELISIDPYQFNMKYTGGDCDGTDCQQSSLTFRQSDKGSATTIQFSKSDTYFNFDISGQCIGQVGCELSHSNIIGIAGLVLILLLIAGVATYFIVGALVMKFLKGAQGRELIPNYTLWVDLPFLIKDGCLFVVSPCYKRKVGYEDL